MIASLLPQTIKPFQNGGGGGGRGRGRGLPFSRELIFPLEQFLNAVRD